MKHKTLDFQQTKQKKILEDFVGKQALYNYASGTTPSTIQYNATYKHTQEKEEKNPKNYVMSRNSKANHGATNH